MGLFTTAAKTWGAEALKSSDLNAQVRDFINGFGATTTYTPSWTSTATNPTIGNGSIVGAYSQINKMVYFRITINFGSTTTFGSGTSYSLTVPVAAAGSGRFMFPGFLYIVGGGAYSFTCQLSGGGTTLVPYYISNGTTSQVGNWSPTVPVAPTAATGNSFTVHGWYEAA